MIQKVLEGFDGALASRWFSYGDYLRCGAIATNLAM